MSGGQWRAGRVHIDDFLGPFDAEIDTTTRWNGWACPRFTREVAQKVAEQSVEPIPLESGEGSLPSDYSSWRWDGDVLELVRNVEVHGDSDPQRWEPDDHRRYHVGSWSWTWSESTS